MTPIKGYNCKILALEELVELHIFGSCVHKACLQMPLNLILINIATADFNNILIGGIKFMAYTNEGTYMQNRNQIKYRRVLIRKFIQFKGHGHYWS